MKTRQLIVFFVAFVVITTAFFLWGEISNFSASSKINHEKVYSYFTVISSVATVITLYFLHKQLRQINVSKNADLPTSFSTLKMFK